MRALVENGRGAFFEEARSDAKLPSSRQDGECNGCGKGNSRANRQRNNDERGFNVVAGLKRMVPVVREFGNMTSKANGNGSDCDELKDAPPQV